MKTKRMTPEIRFEGFTDDWEQRKLSYMMDFSNGINAPKENYGFGTKMISVMDILSPGPIAYEKIINSVSVEKKVEENNKVENGDLIFVRSSEIVEEVGWSKAYLDQKYALYSGFSIRGKKKDNFNSYFVELSLNYFNRKDIERKAGGSTRFNVNQEILKNIKILMPEEQEENYIAGMFIQLEHMIALHQSKLDQLQEVKRGMLLKMFPRNKRVNPSIRFNDNFDWQRNKLESLITKNSEKNKDLLIDYVESISNKTGFTNQTLQFDDYTVASKNLSNYYIIRENCFAYNPSRINVGSIAYKHKGEKISVVSPLYISFYTGHNLEDFYLWYWLKGQEFDRQRKVYSEGGVRDTLSYNQLKEIKVSYPDKKEQELIGSFFRKIDRMIELQEKEIECLEESKKGFLQKMFV